MSDKNIVIEKFLSFCDELRFTHKELSWVVSSLDKPVEYFINPSDLSSASQFKIAQTVKPDAILIWHQPSPFLMDSPCIVYPPAYKYVVIFTLPSVNADITLPKEIYSILDEIPFRVCFISYDEKLGGLANFSNPFVDGFNTHWIDWDIAFPFFMRIGACCYTWQTLRNVFQEGKNLAEFVNGYLDRLSPDYQGYYESLITLQMCGIICMTPPVLDGQRKFESITFIHGAAKGDYVFVSKPFYS